MTRNLRIALTILSVGFALEGVGELYSRIVTGSVVPGGNLLFILPEAIALIGLIFVWVGRDEWNDVHRVRAHTASRVFFLSLLGGFVAAGVLALLVWQPSLGVPLWAEVLFGAAVASLVFGTFVTYAYLVYHLVSPLARVAVFASLVWAFLVSAFAAVILGQNLGTVLSLIQARTVEIPKFVAPVDFLISYLFLSYFLLLAAYVDAHVAVARGLVIVPNQPGVPVTRIAAPQRPVEPPQPPH